MKYKKDVVLLSSTTNAMKQRGYHLMEQPKFRREEKVCTDRRKKRLGKMVEETAVAEDAEIEATMMNASNHRLMTMP